MNDYLMYAITYNGNIAENTSYKTCIFEMHVSMKQRFDCLCVCIQHAKVAVIYILRNIHNLYKVMKRSSKFYININLLITDVRKHTCHIFTNSILIKCFIYILPLFFPFPFSFSLN